MNKELPLPAIIGIAIIVIGLVVFGLIHAMAPHETVISNPGEAQAFQNARLRAAQQGQQTQTWPNAQPSPPGMGAAPAAGSR